METVPIVIVLYPIIEPIAIAINMDPIHYGLVFMTTIAIGMLTPPYGILIFVDILKELPMTLLLRPFNFETLATYVYQYASDEMLEESSLAAIIIILAGLGPIILLNSTIKKFSFKKDSFETTEVLTTGAHS